MFTVALDAEPDADVSVTVARTSGDADITVQAGAALLFTTTDWATPRTVTLAAAEDDADTANGTATIQVSATGLTPVNVTATELDDDATLTVTGGTPAGATIHEKGVPIAIAATPAAHYHFTQWTGDTAGVADVNAASTTITLTADAAIVAQSAIDQYTVSASAVNGTVTGAGTYDYGSVAELTAIPDPDCHFLHWTGDVPAGHETDNPLAFTVTSDVTLTAQCEGNAPLFVIAPLALSVPEGGTNAFTVALSKAPVAGDLTVTVSVLAGGDPDLSIASGATLLFDAANWNTPQPVTVAAAEDDADADNGTATIEVAAPGLVSVTVTATEIDNDRALTVTGGTPAGTTVHAQGAVVAITAPPASRT
jgi:hypothetical protein